MWPAVQEALGFVKWNEPPDADVAELPPAPEKAGPVPDLLRPTSLQPRIDRMLQYNRRTMRRLRKVAKDPKWDSTLMTPSS